MIAKTYHWVAASKKRQWAIAIIVGITLAYLAGEIAYAVGYWSAQPLS